MKRRVLQVVVICGNEHRERHQGDCQRCGEQRPAGVGEGRVGHQAGGVDHGELIDELHGVFERGVEEEAAGAHEHVADEGHDEDCVMVLG